MLEDKLLIWKLRRGSLDALRRIYDKYKVDLLKLAIALTGDVCQSEDAVQDVFLKLVEFLRQNGHSPQSEGYLTTCLVNRVRTLHRSDRRYEKDVSLDPATAEPSEGSPEQWASSERSDEAAQRGDGAASAGAAGSRHAASRYGPGIPADRPDPERLRCTRSRAATGTP